MIANEIDCREVIERAGAVYLGVKDGSVRFRDPETDSVLSLYIFACRTTEDVELALKSAREPQPVAIPAIASRRL